MRLLLVILALVFQTCLSELTANIRPTGAPTTVVLTIQNDNPYPVALLRYHLPLDPRFGGSNNFIVYLDDQPVPYIGARVKYADPDVSEYVFLGAQEMIAVTVDLHNLYDFTKIGNYKIQFDYFVSDYVEDEIELASVPRRRENFTPSFTITSNPLTLTVTEPSPAQVKAVYPCSASETSQINQGATALRTQMTGYAQNIIDGGNTATYREWFGAHTQGRWQIAEEVIRYIRTNNVVGYACDDMANVYAYVYPSDSSHTIYCCSAFWPARVIGGWDTKAGTLLHELSHFNNIGGTSDWAYGTGAARQLAISNPARAVNNADNFEYFGESGF